MSMMMIGMDIAKPVFYLHGEDEHGREVIHKKLSCEKLVPFIANLPPSVISVDSRNACRRLSVKMSAHRTLLPCEFACFYSIAVDVLRKRLHSDGVIEL